MQIDHFNSATSQTSSDAFSCFEVADSTFELGLTTKSLLLLPVRIVSFAQHSQVNDIVLNFAGFSQLDRFAFRTSNDSLILRCSQQADILSDCSIHEEARVLAQSACGVNSSGAFALCALNLGAMQLWTDLTLELPSSLLDVGVTLNDIFTCLWINLNPSSRGEHDTKTMRHHVFLSLNFDETLR